jgi:hypothetical protein
LDIKALSYLWASSSIWPLNELFRADPYPGQLHALKGFDLASAAAYLGKLHIMRQATEGRESIGRLVANFGHPFETAALGGSIAVMEELYRKEKSSVPWDLSCRREQLEAASHAGLTRVVEYLLGSEGTAKLVFRVDYDGIPEFDRSLRTPSVEIFNMLMRYREVTASTWDLEAEATAKMVQPGIPKLKPDPPPQPLTMDQKVELMLIAAENGWEDMVAHLIELRIPVDGPDHNHWSGRLPLFLACKSGHEGIARLLLRENARITGYEIRVAAAGGYLGTVRLLLQHGSDPIGPSKVPEGVEFDPIRNMGYCPAPIVSAVRLEHEGMFRLLVENGADLVENGPEAARVAREDGLDSMLELLREYNVKTEEEEEEGR